MGPTEFESVFYIDDIFCIVKTQKVVYVKRYALLHGR